MDSAPSPQSSDPDWNPAPTRQRVTVYVRKGAHDDERRLSFSRPEGIPAMALYTVSNNVSGTWTQTLSGGGRRPTTYWMPLPVLNGHWPISSASTTMTSSLPN